MLSMDSLQTYIISISAAASQTTESFLTTSAAAPTSATAGSSSAGQQTPSDDEPSASAPSVGGDLPSMPGVVRVGGEEGITDNDRAAATVSSFVVSPVKNPVFILNMSFQLSKSIGISYVVGGCRGRDKIDHFEEQKKSV
jgi:hypothetical protein